MSPKVFVHFGFKENTGRSTMNAVFAFLLGRMKESTLFIDLDPRTTSTKILARTFNVEIDQERTIYSALATEDVAANVISLNESLSLLPGDWRLGLRNFDGQENLLYRMIGKIKRKYKYVLVDMPSTASSLADVGLAAATNVFLTLENQKSSYLTFTQDVQYLDQARKRNIGSFAVSGILLSMNRGNPSSKANLEFIRDARSKFKDAILSNPSWNQERIHSVTTTGISTKGNWDIRVLQMYQNILNEELTRIEA